MYLPAIPPYCEHVKMYPEHQGISERISLHGQTGAPVMYRIALMQMDRPKGTVVRVVAQGCRTGQKPGRNDAAKQETR
ncbi:hypothetical protein BG454_09775 [Roseinatronobacter bogoriensis subsp. barguzinensis]|uniref:Uncharacterized protein n=1 Tax=Roseinatronobacter bogoriensis subsp. barguzinensis TaxID=441209 RepID=A0A2K8KDS1_9RHOB|nr:hypothetical protein BG454_09775 [Rhodobaca barguzinensis]